MDTRFLFFMALLATILFFSILNKIQSNNKTLAPYPPALPVIGHIHLLKESLHRTLESLSHRYGPVFRLRLGCCHFLIVSSPHAIENCLVKNDVVFSNRPPFLVGKLLGYNNNAVVWASYGDLLCNLRRVTSFGAVSSHRIQKFTWIWVEEAQFVAREVFLRSGSCKVDVNMAAFMYTRNLVMRMVTGNRWTSDGPHVDELFVSTEFMTVCDFFPILRWFGYDGLEKKMRQVGIDRDRFIQSLIDDKRAEGETTSSSSILDELLLLQKQEPEYYTDNILKGIIVVIFTSSATLARTMEWAMSLLLNHPVSLDKARSEIDHHVGIDRLVSNSDVSSLNFLRCIVNETLRLYPVAPLLFPHHSSTDTTVAGYHVDKGTTLLFNVWALHHDPSVWEDALDFKPERFEGKDAGDFKYKFIPFGMGRRMCPSSNLAMQSIMLALATWIQCFDWDLAEDGVVNMEELGGKVTMPKSQHLQAICTPRASMINILST